METKQYRDIVAYYLLADNINILFYYTVIVFNFTLDISDIQIAKFPKTLISLLIS